MSLIHPLIDVKEFVEIMPPKSQFLTPITGEQGSSTTAFCSVALSGDLPRSHQHKSCDEISILLRGEGVYGLGDQRIAAQAGDCRIVPKGTGHFFANESDEPSLMVGFFAGAKDVAATGIEYGDAVTADDLATPRGEPNGGILINLDDVQPENMDQGDGWLITDFRLPISARNGCSSTLFRARFLPGAVHKKHRHDNCDEIYYIISGHGLAGAGSDRVEVRGGHFHFIPKGVEHWLHNLSETEPIEVVGLYCGAGSVAATGYVYMGDVTSEDLAARTG
ncbi:MAG: cupin domain-containing protein [Rhodospirillaceae bacterium]|nr:cupin domain-containing protein [Rhodospirillaceae bacterium]